MNDFKIILFLCSWGPHTAYQMLQDGVYWIPQEINLVRIPCTGRISKALLFKAFEMGADGVALVGCSPGTCRYGVGTEMAGMNTADTRDILDLLGLDGKRLQSATFMPDDAEALHHFITDFCEEIKTIGKTPVTPSSQEDTLSNTEGRLEEILVSYDIYACQDCGKCSSACPLTLAGKPFSPRGIANAVVSGFLDSPALERDVWSCLTCGVCSDRCPSAVDFPEFIREMRHLLKLQGSKGLQVHGGFFPALMKTMTSTSVKPKHWQWLPKDIETDTQSNILFFGGCAPYFDVFFRTHLGIETKKSLVDSLRLLNFFDIHPALIENERCCGHDLLWTGDRQNFLKLARLNVEAIHDRGVQEVITSCPECYRALSHDYPEQGIKIHFQVTHIFDFLENEIDKGAVDFKKIHRKVTFQDPCRLSRFDNRPDLPRKLLQRLDTKAFTEMQDRGSGAICCGNSGWTGCDSFSKALQKMRLEQAKATGSDLLITACPKCQIHLRCAMEEPFKGEETKLEMIDLTSVVAETIFWK